MECKSCKMEVQASSAVCPSCEVLLNAPEIGTLASPVRRLIAYFIDYGLGLFLAFISFGAAGAGEEGAAIIGVLLLGFFIIQLVMLAKSTSLGKMILGMKVYKKTGEAVGFGRMFLREAIGKIISGMIFSLGYIWILIDDENQAWHDKLISSIVVQKN
ncbi:RDD family protein [Fuchsiella alkaliacetigena]|uniref:RDD family protein n=1 Tax=Fuchsiella alkaliacetigena TaxID=957042 RepID=UPI00200AFCF7|nr:RDD family protein [Fuchsiella alkaliacetigena]MCK8823630.1 RDD family protein [Fuchsiella alkaliacetigena]